MCQQLKWPVLAQNAASAEAFLGALPAGLPEGVTGRPKVWVWVEESERGTRQ